MGCLLHWGLRGRERLVHYIISELGRFCIANVWAESYDIRIEIAERTDTIISGSLISLPRYADAATSNTFIIDRVAECNRRLRSPDLLCLSLPGQCIRRQSARAVPLESPHTHDGRQSFSFVPQGPPFFIEGPSFDWSEKPVVDPESRSWDSLARRTRTLGRQRGQGSVCTQSRANPQLYKHSCVPALCLDSPNPKDDEKAS